MPCTLWHKAGDIDVGFDIHRAAEHRHRIGVIEHQGIWAITLHVAGDIDQDRYRAQRTENAGDAARVADVHIDAVFHRDLDIVPPDLGRADQNCDDHIIGATQRFDAVHGGAHGGRIFACFDNTGDGALGEIKALGVDIHQRDLAAF